MSEKQRAPIPKAPAIIRRSATARRAWRDLWTFLHEQDQTDPAYLPIVTTMAMELGMAEDAANAIYHPISPVTGKRVKRTLEQYLSGSGPPGFVTLPRNSQTSQELTLLRDSMKQLAQLARLAAEFPTSPLSRKRIGAKPKNPEQSEMMKYIQRTNERIAQRGQAS